MLRDANSALDDLRALHRNLDLMMQLIGYLQAMGWDPYANDHEDANCQFEINWTWNVPRSPVFEWRQH